MTERRRPQPCHTAGGRRGRRLRPERHRGACLPVRRRRRERDACASSSSDGGDGWHRGFAPGLTEGARYGLRVDGPFDPARGHRFDAAKLLVDPYAAEIDRPFALHPSMFERGVDSAAAMPKCVVARRARRRARPRPRRAWADTVIYELNLRGFTRLRMDIPESARGRFAALAEQPVLDHIKSLGVTTVEIMPADAFVDERHLPPLGLTNAWGYNPVFWGAPDPRLAPGGWREVRRATDALHAAGLEVVLDVVLNHNGESDELGPTLSFRGLDNAAYFRLLPDDPARYINDMGCGNCLALDRPHVVALAVAALRRWMEWGGIDGFRFDLATALGRRASGFDAHAPLLAAIAEDPVLATAKLIAEPWDIGPGGYQLGAFPDGWGEWNDRFRDATRRFWRGDARMRGELATRLAGSHDMFARRRRAVATASISSSPTTASRSPTSSPTRTSTTRPTARTTATAPTTTTPGTTASRADSDDPGHPRRPRRATSAICWRRCSVARGTPMLPAGAEIGHSQKGNNNAYAQDNAISWLDWTHADAALAAFVGRLAALRARSPGAAGAGLARRPAGRRRARRSTSSGATRSCRSSTARIGIRPTATC